MAEKQPFEFGDKTSDFVTERDFLLQIPTGVASKSELLVCYQKEGNFPNYFGHNWDALSDFLRDFSWITQRRVVIAHDDVPLSTNEEELRTYLETLATAVTDWKTSKEGPFAEPPEQWPYIEHELRVVFPTAAKHRITSMLDRR